MRASISVQVEVDSIQRLTALRTKLVDRLGSENVTVIASSSAVQDEQFTVIGSRRGSPDESWSAVVHAQDQAEAEAKALQADDQRTVVAVLDGVVAVG